MECAVQVFSFCIVVFIIHSMASARDSKHVPAPPPPPRKKGPERPMPSTASEQGPSPSTPVANPYLIIKPSRSKAPAPSSLAKNVRLQSRSPSEEGSLKSDTSKKEEAHDPYSGWDHDDWSQYDWQSYGWDDHSGWDDSWWVGKWKSVGGGLCEWVPDPAGTRWVPKAPKEPVSKDEDEGSSVDGHCSESQPRASTASKKSRRRAAQRAKSSNDTLEMEPVSSTLYDEMSWLEALEYVCIVAQRQEQPIWICSLPHIFMQAFPSVVEEYSKTGYLHPQQPNKKITKAVKAAGGHIDVSDDGLVTMNGPALECNVAILPVKCRREPPLPPAALAVAEEKVRSGGEPKTVVKSDSTDASDPKAPPPKPPANEAAGSNRVAAAAKSTAVAPKVEVKQEQDEKDEQAQSSAHRRRAGDGDRHSSRHDHGRQSKSRRVIHITDSGTQTDIQGDDMDTLIALLNREKATAPVAAEEPALADFDTFLRPSFRAGD